MNLTSEEKEFIRSQEKMLDSVMSHVDAARKFKMDDFLIAFTPAGMYNGKRTQVVNSYGVPKKFKVVAVDKYEIPYIKELNRNGKPVGRLMCPMASRNTAMLRHQNDLEFEVDPDYADAIILDDTNAYDASADHKNKSSMFKEITDHNKKIKVPMHEVDDVVKYMTNLKVGDIIWHSNRTSIVITAINPLPKRSAGKPDTHLPFIDAINNKGKVLKLSVRTLQYKAVYTDRPRSYKELKDHF